MREDGAYLVPLRLFIGLGWLRAGVEKVTDPGWRDGSSLATFLSDHVSAGDVAFPWYETLIAQVFLPHAVPFAVLIMLGQFLTGVAIAGGVFTNAALLGGLFMNLNFLLAGEPNPSTFYIVIQAALLLTHTGAIVGLDAGLARTIRNPLLVAQPLAKRRLRRGRVPVVPIAAISLVTAAYALAYVTDWSPAGSVDDPAMIVAILALLSLTWVTIAWLRQDVNGRRALRRRDTLSPLRQESELRRAAGILRLGQVSAAVTRLLSVVTDATRWRGAPRPHRRLALTVALTWLDEAENSRNLDCDQHSDAVSQQAAARTTGWRIPAIPYRSPPDRRAYRHHRARPT